MAGVGRVAVFLDRDGVINVPVVRAGLPYPPRALEEFVLYPEVAKACQVLHDAGFLVFVVTNQPDVGRGTLTKALVEEMHRGMLREVPLDGVYVCYHGGGEEEACACRKPLPGMLHEAAVEFSLDLSRSWMIGDRWRDVDCGLAAGCRTIWIDRGYAEEMRHEPDFSVGGIEEAVLVILGGVTD